MTVMDVEVTSLVFTFRGGDGTVEILVIYSFIIHEH